MTGRESSLLEVNVGDEEVTRRGRQAGRLVTGAVLAGVLIIGAATTALAEGPPEAVVPPAHSNAGCVGVAVHHPNEGGGPPGQVQRIEHYERFGYARVSPTAHRPHGCF